MNEDKRTSIAKRLDKKINARLNEKLLNFCVSADLSKIKGTRDDKITWLVNLLDEKMESERPIKEEEIEFYK